jgi:hypothetical protein
MKKNFKYLKNSNSGELIIKIWYTETKIKGIPEYFYGIDGKSIPNPDLTGFVEISEKTYNREGKKLKKNIYDQIK